MLFKARLPPPSFPTWLRQRGVRIGSPFSPRFPGLHQCPCLCVTFSLRPSVPPTLSVPVSFSISLYPFCGKLTYKCEFQSLQEFVELWLNGISMIFTERWQFSIHRVTSWFTQLNHPSSKSCAESRRIRVIRAACAGVQNTARIKDTNQCLVYSLTYLLNIFYFRFMFWLHPRCFVQVRFFFA